MSNSTFQSYLNIFSIFPYRTLISWDECLNSLKWGMTIHAAPLTVITVLL